MEKEKIFKCQHCGSKNRIQSGDILFAKCGNCSEILFDYREKKHNGNKPKENIKKKSVEDDEGLLFTLIKVYFAIFAFFYYVSDDIYFSARWPVETAKAVYNGNSPFDNKDIEKQKTTIKQLTGYEGSELFDPLSIPAFSVRYRYFNKIYNSQYNYTQDEAMLKTYVHFNTNTSLRIGENFNATTSYNDLYKIWDIFTYKFTYKKSRHRVDGEEVISLGYYNQTAYLGTFSGICQDVTIMLLELMTASGKLNPNDVYIASGSNHMWLKIYIDSEYFYVDQANFLPYAQGLKKAQVTETNVFNVGTLLRRIIDFS